MLARIPIRLRVTLAFSLAMALLLLALGLFVHSQQRARLDESIENALRTRAGEEIAQVAAGGTELPEGPALIESDESFAQLLAPSGEVLDGTGELGASAVIAPADLERALSVAEPVFVERDGVPGIEGRSRILAAAAETDDGPIVVVVGSSLGDRDEALANLRRLLLIGGLAALLIASLCGYLAAAAALRPVDELRRRAAELSAGNLGERLPVPPAVDELSRLAVTLNEMLTRLAAAIERERRFVDDASHELRTPLTLHRAELELALRYASDADALRAAIASAIDEADRLIRLSESLLVVARSEHGSPELGIEELDAAELLEAVAARMRPVAEREGRSIAVDATDGTILAGDRLWLEQAVVNLVENAIGHGSGEVRLWARRSGSGSGSAVRIGVSDQGEGFPDGFAARAFERFSRADEARGRGGTGLGLAIVETIAHAHGGSAGAGNGPAGGAEVWIEVAAADAAGS